MKVLFVCMANCCRSQMAEGLARKLAPDWQVQSAGLLPAGYVSSNAIVVMQEVGVDISQQVSKGLDEVDVDGMNVVISMGGFPTTDFVSRPEGKVTEDQEVLLMMKTSRDKFAALEKEVLRLHSYAVPEVIAVQIVEGSKNYLNWIEESLKGE